MKRWLSMLVVLAALGWFGMRSGSLLVVDQPRKSDAIVVLAGDSNDHRFWKGMQLLREGWGRHLLVDASDDSVEYGRTPAQLARGFIAQAAGDRADQVSVCEFGQDSTNSETSYVGKCLERLRARSVLLVTSDFHTRRALAIFSYRLPQYQWSVAAAPNPAAFMPEWWKTRESAKTYILEWQRLIWWYLVDRWRQ